ncbi:MAG: hypothetical protein JXB13_13250 [Phycisphaerae bacterium]|nr:hypothetical protein [Phycisphaerae bacterium]
MSQPSRSNRPVLDAGTTPRPPSQEARLDQLLHRHGGATTPVNPAVTGSPLDALRERFKSDLIPEFQALADKYSEHGIQLHLDIGEFLRGGSELIIDVEFESRGVRYSGIVLPHQIAFQVTQYTGQAAPAVASGPALRIHNLTRRQFREFICERIAEVVRYAVHHDRPAKP